MTSARKDIYVPTESGVYHCVTRCVRRAFICGVDGYTRKSYEHRRQWVKARLTSLLKIFAIDCFAYAAMSNHLHLVLRTVPQQALMWSDLEVAQRWRRLFPKSGLSSEAEQHEILRISADPKLVQCYRERLSNLSWFNRCLNEYIARRANAEDECTGRFWEGRFKCQKLEGDGAVVACSVYVDLNPMRAGIAKSLEDSDYTSIQDRMRALAGAHPRQPAPLLVNHQDALRRKFSAQEYVNLVSETARLLADRKAQIKSEFQAILQRFEIENTQAWAENSRAQGRMFYRVIGSLRALKLLATRRRRSWFKGMNAARFVFGNS